MTSVILRHVYWGRVTGYRMHVQRETTLYQTSSSHSLFYVHTHLIHLECVVFMKMWNGVAFLHWRWQITAVFWYSSAKSTKSSTKMYLGNTGMRRNDQLQIIWLHKQRCKKIFLEGLLDIYVRTSDEHFHIFSLWADCILRQKFTTDGIKFFNWLRNFSINIW